MEGIIQFIQEHGTDILNGLLSALSVFIATNATIRSFKVDKKFNINQNQVNNAIQITRDGIVEAFKKARVGTEVKVSLTNQLDTKLAAMEKRLVSIVTRHESVRTRLALENTKILSYTAAYNKLSENEKSQLNEVLAEAENIDNTVEV